MLSEKLVDMIQEEAAAAGLKGATAIGNAVRAALMERKAAGKVPDERTQTYWVAARYVEGGDAHPIEGAGCVEGLASLFYVPQDVFAAKPYDPDWLTQQVKAARVNLARKAEAHFQVVVHPGAADSVPHAWIDLWVFLSEEAATLCAQSLKAGKIF